MRLVIATPNYGGQLHADMADARVWECMALASAGIPVRLDTEERHCWLTRARNRCAGRALDAGASHLLFWDSDVVPVERGYVQRLVATGHELVAGAYPLKDDTGRVGYEAEGQSAALVNGCVPVKRVGTGFMLIACSLLERMKAHTERYPKSGEWGWFDYSTVDGEPLQDDWSFCDRARAAGATVYVEPTMRFTHIGARAFEGSMGAPRAH